MENRKDILWRVYLVYACMFLFSVAIIGRLAYIQFVQGEMWKEKANKLSLKYFNIEATRGNVFDANGELLATSIPIFEVRMDVASPLISDSVFDRNVDSLSLCLSGLFKDRSRKEYRSMLQKGRDQNNRYLLIRRSVNFEQLKKLRKFPIFRNKGNSSGLVAVARNRRVLPYQHLASRTIGWDKEGRKNDLGLEGAYSEMLEGTSGKRLYRLIANKNWSPINDENEVEPQDGSDIISTIDINLQDVAEEALLRQLEANDAHHGCVILMEVKTGNVKAIANLGKNKEGFYEETYNYAIGESTEPGSTFKLFSLLAALEDQKIKLTDMVDVTGGITKFANRTMRDSHLGGGVMSVQQVFEKSSNVGVSKLIYRCYSDKPQAFIDRLHSFSVAKPLGLEIPGEGTPRIKGTESKTWSKVSLPWKSIGYEVALTPLQILAFYNAVANDGVMVKPHFVKEIRNLGNSVKVIQPEIINSRIASREAITQAKIMLEGVVEHGTGSALKNPIYKVAGKTGTAQIAQNAGGYNKSDYKASFVGYFPAQQPKYSCIVVINNPSKGVYYGGAISAPVFREIADRVYATDPGMGLNWADSVRNTYAMPVSSGMGKDLAYLYKWMGIPGSAIPSTDWIVTESDSTGQKLATYNPKVKSIPNVTGMGARDAVYLLEKLGLRVKLSGFGLVRKQSLLPGKEISPGEQIALELGV
ncbi:MAG: transpeptidase family protein [Bacteroidales bacterium]|nr:transpeptidase family protein [Bacteroidales bacterium]